MKSDRFKRNKDQSVPDRIFGSLYADRTRQLTVVVLLTLMSHSCDTGIKTGVKARFIIVNRSGHFLDSIRIEPDGDLKFATLEADDSINLFTDMTAFPKVDGSYRITCLERGSGRPRGQTFGYFSNGMPAEKITRISILPDTILYTFSYRAY
jgi:hypothetical protein